MLYAVEARHSPNTKRIVAFSRLNQLPVLGFGCNIAPIFSGSDVFLTAQPTRFSE
ncbi:hypothetical protein GMA8713_04434 [Grimontia marina]|uniref:Uncharacterized protein n=1 Tax=Grimontia marina TaxID=646534 RepID=A0A128FIJ9_9GAMM|nr:hypothetical protein GMA8713_04434 [Grimontia marina]